MKKQAINYTLMCDFYELTMANGYLKSGMADKICYFDVFFRSLPDEAGFAIAAGLEQVVEYIENIHFTAEDIAYLASLETFDPEFLEFLKTFRFTGDMWAVPEGTPVFPGEPLLVIRAKAIEAQFLETYVLAVLNHQSLIATKANRIVRAAAGRTVSEFGARRAHGVAAATYGARAAYIGGAQSTSCTLTGRLFGIPISGTMAHSWVQMFPDEYSAFKTYCELYPHGAVLLIDTYDTLKSGLPNAIKAFDEVLAPRGCRPLGVRIDSGDISYLSKRIREALDAAGYPDCGIIASNSLDEKIILEMLMQGGKITSFGVGERLITSKSSPVFDGVYKLVAVEEAGKIVPKIKISENVGKITTPGFKQLLRIFDNKTGMALADLICLHDETFDEQQPLEIFDPLATWKRKVIVDYHLESLLVPIYRQGRLVYRLPAVTEIRNYCAEQIDRIWDEVKRFENPHGYYVDLSYKLWSLKDAMIHRDRIRPGNYQC